MRGALRGGESTSRRRRQCGNDGVNKQATIVNEASEREYRMRRERKKKTGIRKIRINAPFYFFIFSSLLKPLSLGGQIERERELNYYTISEWGIYFFVIQLHVMTVGDAQDW